MLALTALADPVTSATLRTLAVRASVPDAAVNARAASVLINLGLADHHHGRIWAVSGTRRTRIITAAANQMLPGVIDPGSHEIGSDPCDAVSAGTGVVIEP